MVPCSFICNQFILEPKKIAIFRTKHFSKTHQNFEALWIWLYEQIINNMLFINKLIENS